MLYRIILFIWFGLLSVVSIGSDMKKVEALYLALSGDDDSKKVFEGVDFTGADKIIFVSGAHIIDLKIEESIIDYKNYIVERVEIGITGRPEVQRIKLSREDFFYRVNLLLIYIEKNKRLPMFPVSLEIKYFR